MIFALLVGVSYGSFWTRGGYADDFAFLAYSAPQSYLDAVQNWGETFNSRLSQAIMMPLFLKALAGANPGEFHWGAIHGIGLLAFALTLFALDRILTGFGTSRTTRLITLLFFALNPAKNEALLWPATIVGYVLPTAVFLLAAWQHFARAKLGRESTPTLLVLFTLYLFATLAIEQLVPLLFVVVAARLIFITGNRVAVWRNLTGAFGVVVAFLLITFAGKTTERMDPFAQLSPRDVPMRAVEVVLGAFQDLVASAPRIALDPFYREDIIAAVLSVGFFVALFATIALFLLVRKTAAEERTSAPTLLWIFVSGLAVFLATLSPFMVISYYIPARALYLPSLGLALMVGSFAAWSTRFLRTQVARNFFAGSVASATLLFVLVNQYAQHDFARGWELEKGIIEALASERNAIPEGTEISVHNIPRNFGPTPDFHNRFALNGIINWLAPGRSLSGTTLRDFSDVFALPEDISAVTHRKIYPSEHDWVLLWSPAGVYRIASLVLERDGHNNASLPTAVQRSVTRASRIESIQLKGSVTPLELQARYDGDLQVGLSGIITNEHFDLALLPVTIAGPAALERRLHLYAHAHHMNGIKVPYDASVSERGGFTTQTDGYTKYLFLRNWSSIEKLRISLADSYQGRLTPGGNKRAEIEKPTFSPASIEFF